jgi:cytosine/adenosine deaminase-related metal-dependent hydrolase
MSLRLIARALASGLVVLVAASVGCSSSSNGDGPDGAPEADGGSDATAPTGPLCSVTSMGTAGLVLSGRLLLPSGPTTGELFIASDGTIACASASCGSTSGYAAATQIACPRGVISPSLINTHDHEDYATAAPIDHGTIRYQHRNDWREGEEGATELDTPSSTTDASTLAAQELRFVLGGATANVSSGGIKGLLRNLANYTDTTTLEGLTGKTVFFDTFPLGDSNGTLLTSGCAYPKIRSASTAFEDGVYAPHIAEGINAAAENELTCTSSSGLVTSNTSVIHGVGLNATDVDVIHTAGARLIWAPRSNISLYGDTAAVTVYKAEGVPISLGTDWLSSGSMNMLRELSCADSVNQKYLAGAFTDQDLWQMVTSNAAVASGFDSQIGTLATGKVADVAVFDGTTHTDYRAVIAAGVEDVHLVLRGGQPLYGDAALVSALSSSCSALSVCGIDRAVCLDVPSVTLAQVQAAAASIYPLFFCAGTTPTTEPTCVPYRDTYPNGTSATDHDGDGVADATDDCADVFDPVRPLDNGKQSDVDGDGVGDACDKSPLDSTQH